MAGKRTFEIQAFLPAAVSYPGNPLAGIDSFFFRVEGASTPMDAHLMFLNTTGIQLDILGEGEGSIFVNPRSCMAVHVKELTPDGETSDTEVTAPSELPAVPTSTNVVTFRRKNNDS